MTGIYVASKAQHAELWKSWRNDFPIVSSWIDEAGPGESILSDLWIRCIEEASTCDAVVAYHGPGEEWKGAFIEIGAALAHGRPVFLVGWPPGSWVNHPLVSRSLRVSEALAAASAVSRGPTFTDTRNPVCVANWPECRDGDYNPACCRFPKSCSCERPQS